jgi:hypothetical protein
MRCMLRIIHSHSHATDTVCWREKIHVRAWRYPPSPYHSTPSMLHTFPWKKSCRILFEQAMYVMRQHKQKLLGPF